MAGAAALAQASPNGRDYYVQGPDATSAAIRQHNLRMNALRNVMQELQEIAEAVDEQKGGR